MYLTFLIGVLEFIISDNLSIDLLVVVLFFTLGDFEVFEMMLFLELCRNIGDFAVLLKSNNTSWEMVLSGVSDFFLPAIELVLLTDFTDFLDLFDLAVLFDFTDFPDLADLAEIKDF